MPDTSRMSAEQERLGAQNAELKTRASVIVPTRNGAAMLRECLDALRGQEYRDFEVIVVDDASTDTTAGLLGDYPEVRTVRLPGTSGHGFVAAANAGIAAAGGEIIVLLNNDAVPDPGWLDALVDALDRNPWASMAASKLSLYDHPGLLHSAGDYYGLDGVGNSRGVWQPDLGQYEREEEVFGPCAAAAAYRRSALDDVAGAGGTHPSGRIFDPQLWMYCEDVDFNLRARLRGHRTVYVPDAQVRHRLSATGGGPLASYYVGRNTIYLIAKDLPLRLVTRHLPVMLRSQARFALEAARHIREPAARARLRGILTGMLTWPRMLPTRRRLLAMARVSPSRFEKTIKLLTPKQQ